MGCYIRFVNCDKRIMKKLIQISESQVKMLREAYTEGFDLKALDNMGGLEAYQYCVKMLGNPIGEGESRTVFTLNDNMVLKLAFSRINPKETNDNGKHQNQRETRLFSMAKNIGLGHMLAKVYAHGDNYMYIISEAVLPCKPEDFEKIFGIPFSYEWTQSNGPEKINKKKEGDKSIGYNKYFDGSKEPNEYYEGITVYNILLSIACLAEGFRPKGIPYEVVKEIARIIQKNKWFYDLFLLCKNKGLRDITMGVMVGDRVTSIEERMKNLGIVNRDGNIQIVIMDSGYDDTYYQKYKS